MRFTESVGYIVFAVYNWIAVIVLLNMLIAMMTRSFEKINVSFFFSLFIFLKHPKKMLWIKFNKAYSLSFDVADDFENIHI